MTQPIKTICIYGAGALGGAIAAQLASTLGDKIVVSILARGEHLESIRREGIRLYPSGATEPTRASVHATDDPTSLLPQDLVITGLKGHQLSDAAGGIASLMHSRTRVVMVLNGIPWWYFHRDSRSGHAETQFEELDASGALWRLIGPERVIGCVAYQGSEVTAPGEIRLSNDGRYVIGEPSGEMTSDLTAITDLMNAGGIRVTATPRIRDEIWSKLMGNASFNPISALTRATMSQIMGNPSLANMVAKVMTEVKSISEALGAGLTLSVEARLEQSKTIGNTRTSMLQDLLAGKALEIVPLVGMVVSLGRLSGVATPTSETILTLVTQLDIENRRVRT